MENWVEIPVYYKWDLGNYINVSKEKSIKEELSRIES